MAVVIGLAIADMATSLHRLLRNRSRVRWDWVSPLAAVVILTELFNFWWNWRAFTGSTLGATVPYFTVLIILFLAACATLPDEIPGSGIDLRRYFDENRVYFWSVYACYLAAWIGIGTVRDVQRGASFSAVMRDWYVDYAWIIVYFAMIFVRPRWISGAVLALSLFWVLYAFNWWNMSPAG